MDDTFKKYADLFTDLGLTELSVKDGDFEITLKKESASMPPYMPQGAFQSAAQGDGYNNPNVVVASDNEDSDSSKETDAKNDGSELIKAPFVGVFHAGGKVESEPYVSVGDSVKKGDMLCVIEAMKMMNDVQADRDGVIKEICVREGQLVEYGQVLFKLQKD